MGFADKHCEGTISRPDQRIPFSFAKTAPSFLNRTVAGSIAPAHNQISRGLLAFPQETTVKGVSGFLQRSGGGAVSQNATIRMWLFSKSAT
jgi:hypothetical protein